MSGPLAAFAGIRYRCAKKTFDLSGIGGWIVVFEPFLKCWSKDNPRIQ